MKTYVITLSQNFPATHKKAGQATFFKDKFLAAITHNDEYWNKFHTIRANYELWRKRFINAIGAWIFSLGNDPTAYLTPVSQTFATYNGPVQDMTYMIKNDPAVIHFSKSPLWGWEFSNCMLAESNDGYDNVKPVKSSPTAKVDNVQALLSALWLYCQVNGTVQK